MFFFHKTFSEELYITVEVFCNVQMRYFYISLSVQITWFALWYFFLLTQMWLCLSQKEVLASVGDLVQMSLSHGSLTSRYERMMFEATF